MSSLYSFKQVWETQLFLLFLCICHYQPVTWGSFPSYQPQGKFPLPSTGKNKYELLISQHHCKFCCFPNQYGKTDRFEIRGNEHFFKVVFAIPVMQLILQYKLEGGKTQIHIFLYTFISTFPDTYKCH